MNDDLINRQAVLEKMADYVSSGYADSVEDFEEYSRIVCQMPSVTPTQNCVENALGALDCISRQAVIDEIRFGQSYITKISSTGEIENLFVNENRALEDAVDRVKKLPSATPTVIEDIKAEINEGIESYKNKDKAVMYGFMCALYIIDKHIEGWDKE